MRAWWGSGAPRHPTANVPPVMDLGFREHVVEGTPVLELGGDVDLATLPLLSDRMTRFAAEATGGRAVVDLSNLGALEPVALGVIIAARLQLRAGGGELELVCTNPAIRAMFARSGLDAAFTLYDSPADAVNESDGRAPY